MASRKDWRKAICRWQKKLLLGGYCLTLVTEKLESRDALPSYDWEVAARTEVEPHYLEARIKVNPDYLKHATADDLDEKATHEMIHVLLAHYDDFIDCLLEAVPPKKRAGYQAWRNRTQEFTTTHIARIVRMP